MWAVMAPGFLPEIKIGANLPSAMLLWQLWQILRQGADLAMRRSDDQSCFFAFRIQDGLAGKSHLSAELDGGQAKTKVKMTVCIEP